jgi:hypothetical protein
MTVLHYSADAPPRRAVFWRILDLGWPLVVAYVIVASPEVLAVLRIRAYFAADPYRYPLEHNEDLSHLHVYLCLLGVAARWLVLGVAGWAWLIRRTHYRRLAAMLAVLTAHLGVYLFLNSIRFWQDFF